MVSRAQPAREGTRRGLGKRQTGKWHSDASRSVEERRGDRLAAPAEQATVPPPSRPSPGGSDPVCCVQTGCPGGLMRTLLTFDKGWYAVIELVKGMSPFRVQRQRDHRAVVIRPLSPLGR